MAVRPAHADTIRAVQKHEKEKLQITAQLQILRHGLATRGSTRARGRRGGRRRGARTSCGPTMELRQRLTQVTSAIGEARMRSGPSWSTESRSKRRWNRCMIACIAERRAPRRSTSAVPLLFFTEF